MNTHFRALTITKLDRRFWLLFVSHFLVNMGYTLYFLLPLRIEDLGGSKAQIGLVMGTALGSGVIIRFLIGALLDRYGRRIWFRLAGFLTTIACMLYLFVDNIGIFLYAVRIIHGFGMGMIFATYFTAAADIAPEGHQVEIIGLFGISGLLPMALGPWFGEYILNHSPFTVLFGVSAVLSIISLILAFFLSETRPERKISSPFTFGTLFRNGLIRIWIASFIFGAVINVSFTFLAPYVRIQGLHSISGFFGSYVIISIFIRIFLGNLPERIGVFRLYVPAIIVLSGGMFLISVSSKQMVLNLAGGFVGFGHAYIFPILIALASQWSPINNRGVVVTLATALMDLGGMCLSPILGVIGDYLGYSWLFSVSGILTLSAIFVFVGFHDLQNNRANGI